MNNNYHFFNDSYFYYNIYLTCKYYFHHKHFHLYSFNLLYFMNYIFYLFMVNLLNGQNFLNEIVHMSFYGYHNLISGYHDFEDIQSFIECLLFFLVNYLFYPKMGNELDFLILILLLIIAQFFLCLEEVKYNRSDLKFQLFLILFVLIIL